MVDIKELLQYNEAVRHRYFDTLAKLPWDEFVKDRGASFHSLRNIFIHTLGAIDYWLDFLQKEQRHRHQKSDKYGNIDEAREYMEFVEGRMRQYLSSLAPNGLSVKHRITNDAEESIEITAEDVLIHVFEEEVHHRGELIALLWQMDVEPPLMGWKNL